MKHKILGYESQMIFLVSMIILVGILVRITWNRKKSNKRCFLCFGCENCYGCFFCFHCKNCKGCKSCFYCENCRRCDTCVSCKKSRQSYGCKDSCNLVFCHGCQSCKRCSYCSMCIQMIQCKLCHACYRCFHCNNLVLAEELRNVEEVVL